MFLIFFILAGGAGAYIVIVNIADKPAPERLAWKLSVVLVVSTLMGGGLAYALLGDTLLGSNPMPARSIVGTAATVALGLIVGAVTELAVGLHQKAQIGR